jgi:hypothetical protein
MTAVKVVEAPPARASGPEDEAVVARPPTIEDSAPPVIDESAEAEFLAEAKQRGEVVPQRSPAEIEEDANPKALPPLDDLVKRIPADVRETLDDLFRARFTTVKKFPKRALKS